MTGSRRTSRSCGKSSTCSTRSVGGESDRRALERHDPRTTSFASWSATSTRSRRLRTAAAQRDMQRSWAAKAAVIVFENHEPEATWVERAPDGLALRSSIVSHRTLDSYASVTGACVNG